MIDSGVHLMDRSTAVFDIADAIADRTAFVIVAPPDAVEFLAERLHLIPNFVAYIDSGLPVVMRTDQARVLTVTNMLVTSIAVVTVPKTVPAATLTEAFGQTVPGDGSQDLVMLCGPEDRPMVWPLLFVNAIERVDPKVAAQIWASDIRSMS